MVLLMETRAKNKRATYLYRRRSFPNFLVMNSIGDAELSRGLIVMGSNAIDVVSMVNNESTMDMMINDFSKCTFVYGVREGIDLMSFIEILTLVRCVNNLGYLLVILMKC